jgi:RimJ/RimL family protein N-acetyltransferase
MTLALGDDTLETDRLIMRRLTPDDLPFFARMHADPEVARYIGPGRPRTDAESAEWIEGILRSYELVQLGPLAVIRKSDNALIGRCGLSHLEVEIGRQDSEIPRACHLPGCMPAGIPTEVEPELGYAFDRAAWGQGYAREAVAKVHEYSVNTLRTIRLVSLIHPDNARSLKLANVFGVTYLDRLRTGAMVFDRYIWPVAEGSKGPPNSPP